MAPIPYARFASSFFAKPGHGWMSLANEGTTTSLFFMTVPVQQCVQACTDDSALNPALGCGCTVSWFGASRAGAAPGVVEQALPYRDREPGTTDGPDAVTRSAECVLNANAVTITARREGPTELLSSDTAATSTAARSNLKMRNRASPLRSSIPAWTRITMTNPP